MGGPVSSLPYIYEYLTRLRAHSIKEFMVRSSLGFDGNTHTYKEVSQFLDIDSLSLLAPSRSQLESNSRHSFVTHVVGVIDRSALRARQVAAS
jgi:hypothetical protein